MMDTYKIYLLFIKILFFGFFIFTSFGAWTSDLHTAVYEGDYTQVKELLKNGADPNIKEEPYGWTPLHRAVFEKQTKIVEFLLAQKNIIVDMKDSNGLTVLHLASTKRDQKKIELKGLQTTAINWPVTRDTKIVELLIDKGLDVNSVDSYGLTTLHFAIKYGNLEVVKLLIANGINVNAKDGDGQTPLHHSIINGFLDIAELLIANKADVKVRDNFGDTPLHRASFRGYTKMLELFLKKGADPNAKDRNGRTALHFAENLEIAKILFSNGAEVIVTDSFGQSPLDSAISNRKLTVAHFLQDTENSISINNSLNISKKIIANKKIKPCAISFTKL